MIDSKTGGLGIRALIVGFSSGDDEYGLGLCNEKAEIKRNGRASRALTRRGGRRKRNVARLLNDGKTRVVIIVAGRRAQEW
jgi:hypothetical protein